METTYSHHKMKAYLNCNCRCIGILHCPGFSNTEAKGFRNILRQYHTSSNYKRYSLKVGVAGIYSSGGRLPTQPLRLPGFAPYNASQIEATPQWLNEIWFGFPASVSFWHKFWHIFCDVKSTPLTLR